MSLASKNYYQIFSLPESFQVVDSDLEQEYKKLQSEYHPDKFSGASDSERVRALQLASKINDAYVTLKSPLKRAAYLLTLAGIDPEEHNQSHLNEAFLLSQLDIRENLENLIDKEDLAGLEALKASTCTEKDSVLAQFESAYDAGQLAEAKSLYNQLQFLFKLLDEIDKAEEKLLDY